MPDQQGGIRVVNLNRWGTRAEPEEVIVHVDRSNPVLGNPYPLRRRNDPAERERVIALYAKRLEEDILQSGPMSQAIGAIAERVSKGEQIALACWCRPLPCHGDLIAKQVEKILEVKTK